MQTIAMKISPTSTWDMSWPWWRSAIDEWIVDITQMNGADQEGKVCLILPELLRYCASEDDPVTVDEKDSEGLVGSVLIPAAMLRKLSQPRIAYAEEHRAEKEKPASPFCKLDGLIGLPKRPQQRRINLQRKPPGRN